MAIASVVEPWLALVWSEFQSKESSKGAVICSLLHAVGGALAVLVREAHSSHTRVLLLTGNLIPKEPCCCQEAEPVKAKSNWKIYQLSFDSRGN